MRLIDADALGNRLYHEVFEKDSEDQRWDSGCWMRYRLFEKVLKEQPTVEQPERKKGKWIAVTEDGDVYKRICSCCGREAFFQNDDPDELYDGGRYELSDFCPHCGADMREDDHETN